MQQKQQRPTAIFSVYAPSDVQGLERWEAHLHPLELAGVLSVWSVCHLEAGADRSKFLYDHLDTADLIVLLLSADFFKDDECCELMGHALARHQQGTAKLIPLLLRPVAWHETELAPLIPLPSNGRPISRWRDREAAFDDCVRELRRMLGRPVTRPLAEKTNGTSRLSSRHHEPAYQNISRRYMLLGLAGLTTVAMAGGIALLTHIQSSQNPPVASPTPVSSSGTMFGYDLQHTHFNSNEHILSPTTVSRLVPYGTASTGAPLRYSSPVVAGNTVYIGSQDHMLYAFHASTGNILWTTSTGGPISSSPAVADGMVYIGSDDGKLYAFYTATGDIRWTASTSGVVGSSPAVAGGIVYVGSLDSRLYAFHAATGSTLWITSTNYWVSSSPAVVNGVVYVGSWDHKLYAFHATKGNTLWSASVGDQIRFSSPVVANNRIYVGSNDGRIYAFHATTGNPLWTASTGGPTGDSSPAIVGNRVYIGSNDGRLYAFNATTGSPLRTASTSGSIFSSPTIANDVVYIGSDDHKLYAFNATTGNLLWTASTGAPIRSSPAVTNGVLYAGSWDSKLYAFHLPA